MARERIDDIVSQQAIEQLVALGQQLANVKNQMNDLIVDVAKFSAELQGVGSVRDMGAAVNNLNDATTKLNTANKTRLELEREIKAEGEAMAKAVANETNHFEKLADVMEKHVKTQGQTANAIIALQDALKANRQAIKDVTKAYEEGTISTEEYLKKKVSLMNTQESLKKDLKDEQKQYKAINTDLNSLDGSYEQMSARLNQLRDIWRGLSEEERTNADTGGVLQTEINNLDDALKGMDASIGNNQRNVGNYGLSLSQLKNPMFLVQNGLKGIGVQLKALLANPIVLIVGAIVVVLKKLVDEFKKNDDAMTALNSAFEAFRPVLKVVSDIFQFFVGAIAKGVTVIGNLVTAIAGKLNPALEQQAKHYRSLILLEDKLQEAERQHTVASATRQKQIAELTNKAYERDKYTASERKKFLEESQELERRDYEEKKKIAAQKWYLAKENAKKENDTSDETKDNIAALLAAYIDADREYAEHSRRRVRMMQTFAREEQQLAKDAQKQREKELADLKAIEEQEKENARLQMARKVALTQSIEDLSVKLMADAKQAEKARHQLIMSRLEDEEKSQLEAAKDEEEKLLIQKLYDEKMEEEIRNHNTNMESIRAGAKKKEYDNMLQDMNAEFELLTSQLDKDEATYKERLRMQEEYWNMAEQINKEAYEKGLIDERTYTINSNKLTAERMALVRQEKIAKAQAAQDIIGSITDVMMAGAAQIEDEKKRVKIEQAITMAKVLLTESLAIAQAVLAQTQGDPYSFIPRVIASVATITGTFITAISAITKAQNAYAEGTDYHRGGSAIVGEGTKNGHWQSEIVETPDGKRFLVDKPTFFSNMPVGTKVIPTEQYGSSVDLGVTNSILERIANKGQVIVNVDDKITNYILTKNSRIRVLNSKFKYN